MVALSVRKPVTHYFTPNQRRVFQHLHNSGKAVGAYELAHALNVRAVNTIYRALEDLCRFGLVHRIESQNAYVVCDQAGHHKLAAIMVCQDCGAVQEIKIDDWAARLRRAAFGGKFTVRKIAVEVIGYCKDCHGSVRSISREKAADNVTIMKS